MSTPLISVIVPVYKVEKYLAKCVDSIVNQTYKNLEIILVDDGSPDNCGKICDDYAVKDCRVKVIHKANGGLVSARNAGYDAVTGEWHMYVDGDDWIDLEACEKLILTIAEHPDEDLIFFNMVEELGTKSIKGKWKFRSDKYEIQYDRAGCVELSRMTLDHVAGVNSSCAKLIRTALTKKESLIHNPKLRQGSEDTEFALRVYYACKRCLYINAYFYHYRYNPNSISKKIDERNALYLADCYAEIEKEIVGIERQNDFQQSLYQDVLYVIVTIALTTYFNPQNEEPYHLRTEKFKKMIKSNKIFVNSLNLGSLEGMDKKRKITIFCIKKRWFFFIDVIAFLKQLVLKFGYYKY